jgi:anti-sigma factor RsiW
MTISSFRDVEQLSAYLDGQLTQAEKTRLESRLQSDPELTAALDEIRQVRALLHQTPHRQAPRNFTLTPKMAGIRPPVPRAVPVLSWASAVAMLLFACTIGYNLLGSFSFGAAAPKMTDRYGIGGGPVAAPATAAPATAAPATAAPAVAATTAPVAATVLPTNGAGGLSSPTSQPSLMMVPATASPSEVVSQAPNAATPKTPSTPINPWPYIWLGLAILCIGAALLVRWGSRRSFLRNNKPR